MRTAASRLGGLIAPAAVAVAAAGALAVAPPGPEPRRAIAFAACVCLTGSIAAWLVGCWPVTTPSARVTAGLAATGLRLFPALVGLGWLQAGGKDLAAAGAGERLVIFYLVSLAAELARMIMGRGPGPRRPRPDEVI
jgi:hypothetical protein